jgi:ketosteroid isomerase-like protein
MNKQEIIRSYYAGWERKDRGAVESLLTSDFSFTSPNGDDHINRAEFLAKCWPEAELITGFDLEDVEAGDQDAFVKYLCRTTRATSFRNVEYFQFAGEKIAAIECYFGGTAGYPSKSAARA